MCGVAGIVGPTAERHAARLDDMVAKLAHRGPDGHGTLNRENCVLGHTRLAIVDLDGGHQPMVSEDGQLAITFNGEIYGYREIRAQLDDHAFRTTSDTEVILALYRRHGTELLKHLPGMFAFALWDEQRQRLFCGRDRFGEKPFYYCHGPSNELVFASEIKAIVASGLIDPVISRSEVARYLARLFVHPHRTIYENIFVLPPAHYLVFEDGQTQVRPYWEMPLPDEKISTDEAVDRFRELLESAVQRQLIADVSVGAFLSGGLDSTTIVSAARVRHSQLTTFSFDFEGGASEIEFAREAARHYGSKHIELHAAPTDIGDMLERMSDVYDEPFADSSNIPTYMISGLAREHVKSALTGDGGDEMFGGYDWYRPLYWMEHGGDATFWRRTLARVVGWASRKLRLRSAADAESFARGLHFQRQFPDIMQAREHDSHWFCRDELRRLGFELPTEASWLSVPSIRNGRSNLDDVMRQDISDYMAGDILTKVDRASMAHGLELRAPFLDVDFASFCISLPYRLKMTATTDKNILRAAYAGDWPRKIRHRQKQGFGAPVKQWLQLPSVVELQNEYLGNPQANIYRLLPYAEVQYYMKQRSYKTWILFVLALWLKKHPFIVN